MKRRSGIAAIAAAALLSIPAGGAWAQQRDWGRPSSERRSDGPERTDWTTTVARTDEGGFRMGNPDAPVKLVEYLSLTCPHCAEFTHQAGTRLFQTHVRSGRVSIEYRNFTRDGFDLAAAFLSRCAAPRQYFEMTHYLLGHQPEWMGRMQALTQTQRNELRALPPIQAMQRIVAWLGLDRIAARHGLNPAAQRACLADQAALDRLGQMVQTAHQQHQVSGTPTFLVNGAPVSANDWAGIEPLIRGR